MSPRDGGAVAAPATLSGRISAGPSQLLHDETLAPQFRYEMAHLLGWYVAIEKILVLEYRRLGLLDGTEARAVGRVLHGITAATDQPPELAPDPGRNMSDPAFAIERHVEARLPAPVPAWHVDRSRNDLQATAQLMAARERVVTAAGDLLAATRAAHATAARYLDTPMPGYTQLQAAQVTTPGFHLAALADQLLATADRLLGSYDEANLSPLGAGALTGQEVAFDRDRMARLGGFAGPQPHALVAVASRGWALRFAADVSVFGVTVSRFVTDLMAWGGSDCGFLVLPDELSGISSAMPQKRNYPVLERIRGRTAHLASAYTDVALAQRNTPYTNMVEVSKESTAGLPGMFDTLGSVLRLLTAVLTELRFDGARMRARCDGEYLGGFTLANRLTLAAGVPWRTAQVVAGTYITTALDRGLPPGAVAPDLLAAAAEQAGHRIADPAAVLAGVFAADTGLTGKVTAGSVNPAAVAALLADQTDRLSRLETAWRARADAVRSALAEVDALLDLPHAVAPPAIDGRS